MSSDEDTCESGSSDGEFECDDAMAEPKMDPGDPRFPKTCLVAQFDNKAGKFKCPDPVDATDPSKGYKIPRGSTKVAISTQEGAGQIYIFTGAEAIEMHQSRWKSLRHHEGFQLPVGRFTRSGEKHIQPVVIVDVANDADHPCIQCVPISPTVDKNIVKMYIMDACPKFADQKDIVNADWATMAQDLETRNNYLRTEAQRNALLDLHAVRVPALPGEESSSSACRNPNTNLVAHLFGTQTIAALNRPPKKRKAESAAAAAPKRSKESMKKKTTDDAATKLDMLFGDGPPPSELQRKAVKAEQPGKAPQPPSRSRVSTAAPVSGSDSAITEGVAVQDLASKDPKISINIAIQGASLRVISQIVGLFNNGKPGEAD